MGSDERLPVGDSWNGPQPVPGYHFEYTQHAGGMPDTGLETDGKWEACMLEILCTLKKAEEVFFLQRYDYYLRLIFCLERFQGCLILGVRGSRAFKTDWLPPAESGSGARKMLVFLVKSPVDFWSNLPWSFIYLLPFLAEDVALCPLGCLTCLDYPTTD